MDLKEKRFRILKKEKDGVTLNMNGHVGKYSWDEFNKNMEIKDKYYAVCKPEFIKTQDDIETYLNWATMSTLRIQVLEKGGKEDKPGEFLHELAVLGDCTKKVKELTGFTDMQVIQLIQKRIQILKSPITIDDLKETPEEYRERKAKEAKQAEERRIRDLKYRTNQIGSATESMANVKGADKLKDLFK